MALIAVSPPVAAESLGLVAGFALLADCTLAVLAVLGVWAAAGKLVVASAAGAVARLALVAGNRDVMRLVWADSFQKRAGLVVDGPAPLHRNVAAVQPEVSTWARSRKP